MISAATVVLTPGIFINSAALAVLTLIIVPIIAEDVFVVVVAAGVAMLFVAVV